MKILSLDSTAIEHVVKQLTKFGTLHTVETEPDWSKRYDCIIGRIDKTTWVRASSAAATVILEFPDSALASRIKKEYPSFSRGNILAVMVSYGKLIEDSDMESRFACIYRSVEPVRSVGCTPCQSLTGKSLVPIFHCSLLNCECSVASREMAGQGKQLPNGQHRKIAEPCVTCNLRESVKILPNIDAGPAVT